MEDQLDTVDSNLIREQVRDFIRTNFLYDNAASIDDAASFSELGILDETGALELVMFVEETYGLVVEDTDLLPENFDTVCPAAGPSSCSGVSKWADLASKAAAMSSTTLSRSRTAVLMVRS